MAIRGQHFLAPREGRHQHQQARLRQVKIGKQSANEVEVETGRNEDLRFSSVRLKRAAGGLAGAVLQGANHGGADGDDAPAFGDGAIDRVRSGRGERVALAVEMNLIHALDAQRRKGFQADVERDAGDLDPLSVIATKASKSATT